MYSHSTQIFFGVAWSLSVEEWFYILFPLVLFAIHRQVKSSGKSILNTILLTLVLFLLIRSISALMIDMPWDKGFRKLVIMRLDAIAYGVLGAYFYLFRAQRWGKYKMIALCIGVFSIILFCCFFWWDFHAHANEGFFSKTFLFSLLGIALVCVFPYFNALKKTRFTGWGSIIHWMSLISYSVYLAHPLLIASLARFEISWPMKFVLCWVLTIAVSSLVYLIFEKPTTQLRNRYYRNTYLAEVGGEDK